MTRQFSSSGSEVASESPISSARFPSALHPAVCLRGRQPSACFCFFLFLFKSFIVRQLHKMSSLCYWKSNMESICFFTAAVCCSTSSAKFNHFDALCATYRRLIAVLTISNLLRMNLDYVISFGKQGSNPVGPHRPFVLLQ